jgi:hypothetical protein
MHNFIGCRNWNITGGKSYVNGKARILDIELLTQQQGFVG